MERQPRPRSEFVKDERLQALHPVISASIDYARSRGDKACGTHHLLVGVSIDPFISRGLRKKGITRENIIHWIEEFEGKGDPKRVAEDSEVDFTIRAYKVLEGLVGENRRREPRSFDLFEALIRDEQALSSAVYKALTEKGLSGVESRRRFGFFRRK